MLMCKRSVALLLALCMALSLCGCSEKEPSIQDPSLSPTDSVSSPTDPVPTPPAHTPTDPEPGAQNQPDTPDPVPTPDPEPPKQTNSDGYKCPLCGTYMTDWAPANQGCGIVIGYERQCTGCWNKLVKEEMQWHTLENGTCTTCGKGESDPKNLVFRLNSAGTGYDLVMVSSDHHDQDLIIPRAYNDLPVTGIQTLTVARKDSIQPRYIYLPDTMTKLDSKAINKLTYLIAIWMPDSITELGAYGLANNQALQYIRFSDNLTAMGEYAVSGCTRLSAVSLPDSLLRLGTTAFMRCTALQQVEFGANLQVIGEAAFSQCTALQSVDLPDSVTTIEPTAFYMCSALTSVKLPKSLTVISDNSFYECSKLSQVTWHENITSIGSSAFSKTAVTELPLLPKLQELGAGAFSDCYGLTAAALPGGIKVLENKVFYGCRNLADFDLPASVTSVGKEAFKNCEKMVLTKLPASLTFVGEAAFHNCKAMTLSALPAGLETVEKDGFRSVTFGEYLTVPASLKTVGSFAFYVEGLKYLRFEGTVENCDKHAFNSEDLLWAELPLGNPGAVKMENSDSGVIVVPAEVTNLRMNDLADYLENGVSKLCFRGAQDSITLDSRLQEKFAGRMEFGYTEMPTFP